MAESMIERVARAIREASPSAGRGDSHLRTQPLSDDACLDLARAAIEAMRGINPHIAALVSVNWTLSPVQVGRLFRQAVDAALNEQVSG